MKPEEAREVVSFLHGGFNREPTQAQMSAWIEVVLPLDADVAMRVARSTHKLVERMPTPAMFLTSVRAEVGRERPHSVFGGPRCELCVDDGFVVVYRRPARASQWMRDKGLAVPEGAMYEELAPCPQCQRGRARELAAYPDGFWQGRKWKIVNGRDREVELVL